MLAPLKLPHITLASKHTLITKFVLKSFIFGGLFALFLSEHYFYARCNLDKFGISSAQSGSDANRKIKKNLTSLLYFFTFLAININFFLTFLR